MGLASHFFLRAGPCKFAPHLWKENPDLRYSDEPGTLAGVAIRNAALATSFLNGCFTLSGIDSKRNTEEGAMKAADIRIGETYLARVSGKQARVKITAERTSYNNRRYWLGTNLATKREVTIRGAARLRPVLSSDLHRWHLTLGDGRKVATWAKDAEAATAKAVRLGHTVVAVEAAPVRTETA